MISGRPAYPQLSIHFILDLTVWGVEAVVTHQTSWFESTGVCGVRQNQVGGSKLGMLHWFAM